LEIVSGHRQTFPNGLREGLPTSGQDLQSAKIHVGMMESSSTSHYALGSTEAEHDRLIRQAVRLAPCTERLFREAGIGSGQRVLELGSGVGDVAILAARLVGSSGEVVGIERDARSVARARSRVAEAGFHHVRFAQCDVSQLDSDAPFDAAVGRLILQFVSDPVAVLRRLSQVVRPGGVLVFQEVTYAPLFALSSHLPLWSKVLSLLHEAIQRSGANTEVGIALHRIFLEAGLPAPTMRLEMMLGTDSDFTRWVYDILCSVRPQAQRHNLSLEPLGDFETLPARMHSEVAASKSVVPYVALVGAWAHRPENKASL
jgi:SAM-dependent methyltransferase